MRYSIKKLQLPWGNVVFLEAPYLFEVFPQLGRESYDYIPTTAKAPFYVTVRSPNSQLVYVFERNETDELEKFLEKLELIAIERVFEGGAQAARLPTRDVQLDELLNWVDSRPNVLNDREVDDAEVTRRYAAVRLFCVFSNLYLPTRFLHVRQFVFFSGKADSVTYLEESQTLLRRASCGRQEYLLVARGADLKFVGGLEINRRKKYPILDALVRGEFVTPIKYSGALRRAQEHPALELCRRRGFADGTVLYERRLMGARIDYVAVRGSAISRGPTPRAAMAHTAT